MREAKGEDTARLLDSLKKGEMAREAERLMADSAWLPEILRTPGIQTEAAGAPVGAEGSEVTGADAAGADAAGVDGAEALPAFLAEDGDEPRSEDEVIEAYRIAAE